MRRLLGRCLEKDPQKRLRDISVVWELLTDLQSRDREGAVPEHRGNSRTAWIAAALFAMIAASLAFIHFREKPPAAPLVTRFSYPLPEGQSFSRPGRHILALSPAGTKLAYVANQQLYVRAMDQLEAQPVRGTNEDPMEPVFSPDGQWLAYFVPAGGANGSVVSPFVPKKIAVAGGAR